MDKISKTISATSDKYYIWRTSLKSNVRPEHFKLEGKVFKKGESPLDYFAGDESMNCHCYEEEELPDNVFVILRGENGEFEANLERDFGGNIEAYEEYLEIYKKHQLISYEGLTKSLDQTIEILSPRKSNKANIKEIIQDIEQIEHQNLINFLRYGHIKYKLDPILPEYKKYIQEKINKIS